MKQRNPLIIIFLVALILRLYVAFHSTNMPSCDAAGYDSRAISILEGKGFSQDGKPTTCRDPFYSFFLAGIYYVFGHSYLIVRIIQAIIGALSCCFIYIIGREVFNNKVGILSGFIAGIYPSFIKITGYLLTEALFTFILVLIIFYYLKLLRKVNFRNAIILGFLLGIGSLTRSVLAPFIVLICAALFFVFRKRYLSKKIIIYIFTILMCFLTPIVPWTVRNWLVFHEFIPISTSIGINVYSSYFPPDGKLFGFTTDDENTKFARSLNSEGKTSDFLLLKTWEKIKKLGIGQIFKLEILKFIYFWSPIDWEILGYGRYNFMYGFILPFFIYGISITFKRFKESLPVYLPIIYSFLIALVTYGSPRFRLVIEPFLIILGARGINDLYLKFYRKNIFFSCILILFIQNFLLYLNSEKVRIFLRSIAQFLNLWS